MPPTASDTGGRCWTVAYFLPQLMEKIGADSHLLTTKAKDNAAWTRNLPPSMETCLDLAQKVRVEIAENNVIARKVRRQAWSAWLKKGKSNIMNRLQKRRGCVAGCYY